MITIAMKNSPRMVCSLPRILLVLLLTLRVLAEESPVPEKVEFNRDVRPILADTCFRCHGFDKNTREADIRFDVRENVIAKHDDIFPIVPGKPEESEAWKRITATDEDGVMPPKKANRQLSAREKQIFRKWIEQGAEYQPHWAYIAPVRPAVPPFAEAGFSRNPIDAFLLARQRQQGLAHAPEADRGTLARRLFLDLLGLPPAVEEVDAFVKNRAPDAYERLVESLLSSPRHAERLAVLWLDLVRFADTIGYHSDTPRNVWPYRDYVMRAFQENKPFDRFTIEQVAGDLLPDATQETRVASAYNRLILSTEEGGAQARQYEAKHVTDRVKSIGTTWLAQTFMCCECHDHKYDPVSARDFYSMGAFFADIQEASIGKREDGMLVSTAEQRARLGEFDKNLTAVHGKLREPSAELDAAQIAWEKANIHGAADVAWSLLRPAETKAKSQLTLRPDGTMKVELSGNPPTDTYRLTVKLPAGTSGLLLDALASSSLPHSGPGRNVDGNFVLTEFTAERDGKPLKFSQVTATFEQPGYPAKSAIDGKKDGKNNGWAVMGSTGKASAAYFEFADVLKDEATVLLSLSQNYGENHTIGKFRISATTSLKPIQAPNTLIPPAVLTALQAAPRTPAQQEKITAHFRTITPQLQPVRAELSATENARADFEKTIPRTLVSVAMPTPRVVRVLPRGDWMTESGAIVEPATPHYLPGGPQPAEGQRLTRLDLAQWLVGRDNPLTARVFVNRLWKQFHGIGLSKGLDDLGTQGELPANQALLDWLAVEFMESGWDVRHMVRLMVTSGAYRQGSAAPQDAIARDPFNRELLRQSRWRLDAEFVRDNALSIAGLLVHQFGGPSVKPFQPAGYWENLNFPTREWEVDKGPNQWRRGLYTWWQRSYVHPAMLAFDAPTREECTAERARSNIPQQALVLLNDPEFVEAARAFASRMMKEGGRTAEERIAWAWKTATARAAQPAEIGALRTLFEKHLTTFSTTPQENTAPEISAYTSIARAILNLHETITRL